VFSKGVIVLRNLTRILNHIHRVNLIFLSLLPTAVTRLQSGYGFMGLNLLRPFLMDQVLGPLLSKLGLNLYNRL